MKSKKLPLSPTSSLDTRGKPMTQTIAATVVEEHASARKGEIAHLYWCIGKGDSCMPEILADKKDLGVET